MWVRLVRLVKTLDSTSRSKSHYGWETTHCGPMSVKFDYFRVLLKPSQLEPSLSMRQIFVVHSGLPMDPIVTLQDINAVDRPCKTMTKIPKMIILGYGMGDSCQSSAIENVNGLLSAAISIFWEDPAKCLTPIWVLTCLALGEPSLQLATCQSQTNPPSMNKWLSTLQHLAQAPLCSHQELCIDGVPSDCQYPRGPPQPSS